MTPLRAAIKRWQAATPQARVDVIGFFRDEARQSDSWAKDWPREGKRHRDDAKAMLAACAILRAARKAER